MQIVASGSSHLSVLSLQFAGERHWKPLCAQGWPSLGSAWHVPVPLNAERMQRLEACLARAGTAPPDIEEVIDAFTHPLLDRSARGGPGWKAFFALIAQVNNSPEFGGVVMTRYFDPVVGVFVEALRRALPDCDPREVFWSYQFLSGALTLTFAETGRIDNLSGGLCRSSDLDSVHERLVPFVAAGFRELCARSDYLSLHVPLTEATRGLGSGHTREIVVEAGKCGG